MMESFKYVLRSISSIIRDDKGLKQFFKYTPFLRKLFLISESFDNDEIMSNIIKILRLCLENEQGNTIIFQRFPNTINYIL